MSVSCHWSAFRDFESWRLSQLLGTCITLNQMRERAVKPGSVPVQLQDAGETNGKSTLAEWFMFTVYVIFYTGVLALVDVLYLIISW